MSWDNKRLDLCLVEHHGINSRSKAKDLIKSGKVSVNGVVMSKAASLVSDADEIHITQNDNWVGRGAQKLLAARSCFSMDFSGKIVCDIGASTGGFTQVCLESGASKVYAIDVGKDQLSPVLLSDPRVINMEGVNIRYGAQLSESADVAVVDVSFISLRLVLEKIFELVGESGEIIALYKPQFEVGPKNLTKNGLVRNEEILLVELTSFLDWAGGCEMEAIDLIWSPITGRDGNKELLIYFKKGSVGKISVELIRGLDR
ncbi:MAG: TlyA family RNA methyltransferase [Bacteriovoracaceae bacterium]|jgi:23S rRNA (cytidine1920-2'-O)/16S rRNA (cytidine1409-2'-O)-methyltransferase|nr:TlyA family RNA methyltransferase [Bacteriovoracaceae bacterium]